MYPLVFRLCCLRTALSHELAMRDICCYTFVTDFSSQVCIYFFHVKSCHARDLCCDEIWPQVISNKIHFSLLSRLVCIKVPFQSGLSVWLYHHKHSSTDPVRSPKNFPERDNLYAVSAPCTVILVFFFTVAWHDLAGNALMISKWILKAYGHLS